MTIPSPSVLHFRGGRRAVSAEVYPHMDEFYRDLGSLTAAPSRRSRRPAAATCNWTKSIWRTCAIPSSDRFCASAATIPTSFPRFTRR